VNLLIIAKRKKIETSFHQVKRDLSKVIAELEEVDVESARRIRELERKEEKKTTTQEQIHQNEINYKIHKRIQKSNYEELKAEYERLYSNVDEEIEGIITDLTENL